MRTNYTLLRAVSLLGVLMIPFGAAATEKVTYTYDVYGRLIKVVTTGTVNNNVQTNYSHDKADNRTNVKVEGAPS